MFGQVWNHGSIRKYVIFFGTLFNQVFITREDSNGDTIQSMKVPLNYGPKEKFLARLEGNPSLERPIAISLPRMSFEIVNFSYDPTRKLTTLGRIRGEDPANADKMRYQYNPVPYDIQFNLYIMVKNAEDGTRIVEQILPFFAPEFTATLNVNPELNIKYDVPISLDSVSQEDTYEGSFETRRAIIWTLSFTMKAYIFGPTRTSSVIKQAEINMKLIPPGIAGTEVTSANVATAVEITVIPGLTANGEPTSNAVLSIDKSLIKSTDDYGFITDFQDNF
jgi:T4-like virus Myoviridae tail sheath stabiliser